MSTLVNQEVSFANKLAVVMVKPGSTGTTPRRRTPGTPTGFPPPGYVQPNQAQQLPFEQFMTYQREQMKRFQTQQTHRIQKQQELMMRQQQIQEEQTCKT